MEMIQTLYRIFLTICNALRPAMMLLVRLMAAHLFFVSGMLKIHDWSNTIYLFTNEFPVPLLPPQVAAVISATFELCCPVLLTLGFAARLATLPLLTMTAVINFTYDNNIEHAYWALLLGMILCYGPGKWSVDYWLEKKFSKGASL